MLLRVSAFLCRRIFWAWRIESSPGRSPPVSVSVEVDVAALLAQNDGGVRQKVIGRLILLRTLISRA